MTSRDKGLEPAPVLCIIILNLKVMINRSVWKMILNKNLVYPNTIKLLGKTSALHTFFIFFSLLKLLRNGKKCRLQLSTICIPFPIYIVGLFKTFITPIL